MTKFLGLPTVAASPVFMSGGLGASVSQFAGGALGDSIGHRKIFIAFLFALFLVSSVLATIHSISTSSLLFPVIFGIIMVLNALQSPSSNALVSRASSVQLKGFSILRVGNNLGWGFGPAIGGFILSLYGFPGIFYFFMIVSLFSCAISLFTSKVEPKGKFVSCKFNRENSALIVISIAAMLVFMVQAQETLSLSLYAYGIFSGAYFEIGIVYMINGILVVLTQPILYKISSRICEYSSLVIGTFIYSLGFLSYGFDSNLPQMILSTAIFTMGENLSFPTGYSI
jgi:Arabinose efflux permease